MKKQLVTLATFGLAAFVLSACASSSGGRSYTPTVRASASVGYHDGFYGRRPYYGYPPPVIIAPGPDFDRPVATPLPMEPSGGFGMPDAGMMDLPDFDF